MLNYETCADANFASIEKAWPVIEATMRRRLGRIDPAAAYNAASARAALEPHDSALADAWEFAEAAAYRRAFRSWHRIPDGLTITAH